MALHRKKTEPMKKSHYRLSRYLLMLLALTISLGLQPATGRSEEPPAGETAGRQQGISTEPEGMSETFKGTVAEVIDAGRHVYVHINTGKKLVWVAVPAFDGKPGDKVLVPPGVAIADFKSQQLNRKFKMIYFVGGIRRIDESKPD